MNSGERRVGTSLQLTDRPTIFTSVEDVKARRKRSSTISSKNQITIPISEMRSAGLASGERVVARADGPGRIILEREIDILTDFVGALTGVYADNELEMLRAEWD